MSDLLFTSTPNMLMFQFSLSDQQFQFLSPKTLESPFIHFSLHHPHTQTHCKNRSGSRIIQYTNCIQIPTISHCFLCYWPLWSRPLQFIATAYCLVSPASVLVLLILLLQQSGQHTFFSNFRWCHSSVGGTLALSDTQGPSRPHMIWPVLSVWLCIPDTLASLPEG